MCLRSKYSNYTNEFSNSALENLQESNFGEIFNFIRLRNELIVFYKSEEFLNTNPYDLVKKIKINDLISAFQEVFKLGQLILTIPSTTASVERYFSALTHILYCVKKSEETKCQLQNYRLNLFEKFWETVLSDKGDFELQLLFNEIFDNILTNLQARFGSLNKFEFLSLIDPNYEMKLIVFYKSEEFLNTNPYDLVKKIKINDLISAFQEVFKLGQLILTIPSTTASVERYFSALKLIKSYQRSTQGQERLSSF
ncbi:hypothetical protein QTP88_007028 [Uroleucon formosanum]